MKMISKIATASAVAAMGLGLGAAGASANVTVVGGAFSGSNSGHTFSAAGLAVNCASANFSGNTASASTNDIPFRAGYTGCQVTIGGIPWDADVTVNSDWHLKYVSGTAGTSVTANVDITPAGSGPAVEIDVPDFGCSITIDDQTGLSHVVAENRTPTAVHLNATVTGITFDSDCPGVTPGNNGTYSGTVLVPGITMV